MSSPQSSTDMASNDNDTISTPQEVCHHMGEGDEPVVRGDQILSRYSEHGDIIKPCTGFH